MEEPSKEQMQNLLVSLCKLRMHPDMDQFFELGLVSLPPNLYQQPTTQKPSKVRNAWPKKAERTKVSSV